MRILSLKLRFERKQESLDGLDVCCISGCVYKLSLYFFGKRFSFVELVIIMRTNASLF